MSELPYLDAVEQRVLGALLEKQTTVPAAYPMTLNSLRTACNQTSSRDPVLDLDDRTIERTARGLRDRGLIRIVWADTGRRTLKYHQILDEMLGLAGDERALVTVLLLRGPQAPGELRTRTERLHGFADRDAVEACLTRLAEREQPVVERLPRLPGQQDHRWTHTLGPLPEAVAALVVEPEPDREAVLAAGPQARDAAVLATYATIAESYAEAIARELDDLPFERWLLDRVAAEAGYRPVVDAGCGPGHVTAYLAAAGADACGLDLSPEMVEQARARFPDLRFDVGDARRLIRPERADGWGAVLGWYSLIHLAPSEFVAAVAALARPLAPGGLLVLACHAGTDLREVTTWFDHEVDVAIVHRTTEEVGAAVVAAGLRDIEWYLRGPRVARGETTERLHLLARRPPA